MSAQGSYTRTLGQYAWKMSDVQLLFQALPTCCTFHVCCTEVTSFSVAICIVDLLTVIRGEPERAPSTQKTRSNVYIFAAQEIYLHLQLGAESSEENSSYKESEGNWLSS